MNEFAAHLARCEQLMDVVRHRFTSRPFNPQPPRARISRWGWDGFDMANYMTPDQIRSMPG